MSVVYICSVEAASGRSRSIRRHTVTLMLCSAPDRGTADPWTNLPLPPLRGRYDDCKTILHPELGRIDVDAQLLFTENRAQSLVVLTTHPGTESHSKLELLSVIGHQQLTP
jgi:hypothetical protein